VSGVADGFGYLFGGDGVGEKDHVNPGGHNVTKLQLGQVVNAANDVFFEFTDYTVFVVWAKSSEESGGLEARMVRVVH
jgi:hypothetical protein